MMFRKRSLYDDPWWVKLLRGITRAVDWLTMLIIAGVVLNAWTTPPPRTLLFIALGWTVARVDSALENVEGMQQ